MSTLLKMIAKGAAMWARIYTVGLPPDARDARRDEVDDDIWSMANDGDLVSHNRASLHMLARWAFGIPYDLVWRVEESAEARRREEEWTKESARMPKVLRVILTVVGVIAVALALIRAAEMRKVNSIKRRLWPGNPGGPFSEDSLDGLPEPVQRYFLHAIQAGTPLASSLHFSWSGVVRDANDTKWLPVEVNETLTPGVGFAISGIAKLGIIPLKGTAYCFEGSARTKVWLANALPIFDAKDTEHHADLVKRLAMWSILVPSALLPKRGVVWEAEDEEHLTATIGSNGGSIRLLLTIGPNGEVREVLSERFGQEVGVHEYIPFGFIVENERHFNGYTVPSSIRAGWWYGSENYKEWERWTLDEARYR